MDVEVSNGITRYCQQKFIKMHAQELFPIICEHMISGSTVYTDEN